MKIAVPQWQGRVSPVFDVAGQLLVVDVENGIVQTRNSVPLTMGTPQARAHAVFGLGVDVLICGAVSRPLETALLAGGIEVLSHTCGDVDCVLAAYFDGKLLQGAYLTPGCSGRRRQKRKTGKVVK